MLYCMVFCCTVTTTFVTSGLLLYHNDFFCNVWPYFVLFWLWLYLYWILLYRMAFCCTVQFSAALVDLLLHCIDFCCTVLTSAVLYWLLLYCIEFCCTNIKFCCTVWPSGVLYGFLPYCCAIKSRSFCITSISGKLPKWAINQVMNIKFVGFFFYVLPLYIVQLQTVDILLYTSCGWLHSTHIEWKVGQCVINLDC